MNKIAIVAGVAAVAVLAGCKNPNYKYAKHSHNPAGDEVANVDTTPEAPLTNPDVNPLPGAQPVEFTTDESHCTCLPGTVHTTPCACGANDCSCRVAAREIKPLPPPPAAKDFSTLPGAPAETSVATPAPATSAGAETTPYIIQRGDTLALISKRYNIKLDALRKANPQIKNDVVVLGRTITLPAKVDVGEQKIPAGALAPKPPKPEYKPYAGATATYTVKDGDYLGKIAHGHKISVRQLKELNGLSSDVIRVGQKLKVPAGAAPAPAAPATTVKTNAPAAVAQTTKKAESKPATETKPVEPPAPPVVDVANPDTGVLPSVKEPESVEDNSTFSITVEPGDDITSISLTYSVDPAVIRDLNGMDEDGQVYAGQTIKLPIEVK